MKENAKCKKCGRYLNNRIVTVDTIIVRNNKILLVKRGRDPMKNYWALPGGIVNIDKNLRQTAVAEAKEETGLKVAVDKLVGIYDDPKRDPSERHAISLVYSVKILGGKVLAGDDAKEVRWFFPNQLPRLAFDHERIIRNFLKTISI